MMETSEVAAPGTDGWISAYVSEMCAECRELDADTLECRIRGFQMDRVPPVQDCADWERR